VQNTSLRQFERSYLSAAVFRNRLYHAVDRLSLSDLPLLRGVAKELVEEVWPISIWLTHLDMPKRHVRARYLGPRENYDASLLVEGGEVRLGLLQREYFVEVTTAGSPRDYLRREALERQGGSLWGGRHPSRRLEETGR
jgi:hypothetical protein